MGRSLARHHDFVEIVEIDEIDEDRSWACGPYSDQAHALRSYSAHVVLSYLIEREKNTATARAVITDLLNWAQVATTGHPDALHALQLSMTDFEDALQVAAARACGASYIITRNVRDFGIYPVPAVTPEKLIAASALG